MCAGSFVSADFWNICVLVVNVTKQVIQLRFNFFRRSNSGEGPRLATGHQPPGGTSNRSPPWRSNRLSGSTATEHPGSAADAGRTLPHHPSARSAKATFHWAPVIYAFIPLSKVDKISQQLHRQPHPNHWSWHQNTRLPGPPGPPGPPPPTRPILTSSSPSQGPQSLSQQVRKYGSAQTNTRSPTSSLVQNPGFSASQVSRCST